MVYLQRMKEVRTMAKDTQTITANRLNMVQQQYQKYETGKNELPIRYLIEFCKIYNISADYILGLKDEPAPPNPL